VGLNPPFIFVTVCYNIKAFSFNEYWWFSLDVTADILHVLLVLVPFAVKRAALIGNTCLSFLKSMAIKKKGISF
jgi:hypothetical protein